MNAASVLSRSKYLVTGRSALIERFALTQPKTQDQMLKEVKDQYKLLHMKSKEQWPSPAALQDLAEIKSKLDEIKESSLVIKVNMFHMKVLMMDFDFDETLSRDSIIAELKKKQKIPKEEAIVSCRTDYTLLDIMKQSFRYLHVIMLEDAIVASYFEHKNSSIINDLVDELRYVYGSDGRLTFAKSGYLQLKLNSSKIQIDKKNKIHQISCYNYPSKAPLAGARYSWSLWKTKRQKSKN